MIFFTRSSKTPFRNIIDQLKSDFEAKDHFEKTVFVFLTLDKVAQVLDILGINASCELGKDIQVIFKSCVNMVLDTCLKAFSC